MTTRNYSSRSQQSTLTGAVTSGATSMVVVSGTSLLGGVTIPAGTTFTIVIDPDTALEEIVDATAVSTNTFTITRAIDGSSAQAHSAGAVVRHMAIGRDYRESNAHVEASTGVHGISNSSSVVGTIDTQTLTNKTLTSPTITNPNISGAGVDASIVFEGATPDAFETTLTVVDPTQDNTLTLPNTTGTVVVATAVQTLTNKTLTSPTISGSPVITGLSSAGMSASSATPKDYVDSILGSATAAATSAASAAASATAAATSATSAAASATAAAASAVTAGSSATAAATSATSAAASATAAATSATSAAASATAAATSATSASASATASATSATASATSATASATSASAAATSASSAATSASSAATSATSSALSYTTFNDQYLGSKSTAPTLNNSGGALASGNLYFNTTDSTLYVYNVSAWQAAAVSTAGFATLGTNAFTAAQTITVASGTAVPLTIQNNGTGNSFVINDVASDTTPFVVDSNGALGIGTAPTVRLDVIGPTGVVTAPTYPNQTSMAIRNNFHARIALVNANPATYSSEIFSFAPGAANPSQALSMTPLGIQFSLGNTAGSVAATERMRIDFDGLVGINGAASGTQFQVINSTAANVGTVIRGAASQTGDLLQIQNSAATELFTIDSAGKVGIGNASPTYTLDVSSTARVGGSTANAGTALISNAQSFFASTVNWNYGNIEIIRNAANTSTPRFIGFNLDGDAVTSTTIGATNSIWGIYDSAPTTGSLSSTLNAVMGYGAYAGHRWYTNGTERMRISSTGNVFIGTNVTAGQNTGGLTIQGKDIELMQIMGAY